MFDPKKGDPTADRVGIDGDDPMAPVGPDLCRAEAAETLIEPGERSGPPQDSHYRAGEVLQDSFLAEELATPLAADGLPDHSLDDVGHLGTHPFHIDNQVCIADERVWVEIFFVELLDRGWLCQRHPEENYEQRKIDPNEPGWIRGVPGMKVTWVPPSLLPTVNVESPIPSYVCFDVRPQYDYVNGSEAERRTFKPEEVIRLWGQPCVRDPKTRLLVPVRPVRERCIHNRRQHFGNDDQPDPEEEGHNIIFRMCAHPARRSIGGAAMNLNNEAIYGCDFREPRTPSDTAWLDKHDRNKVMNRPDKVRLPMFGLEGDEVYADEAQEALAATERQPSPGDVDDA